MKNNDIESITILHSLVDGLMATNPEFEDIATEPLLRVVKDLKQQIFKGRHKNNWDVPEDFMHDLFAKLKEQKGFGRMHYERLGTMGFKIFVDHCEAAHKIHARKIIGPVCPKILMIALMLKSAFPELKLKVEYSSYTKDGSASEVLIK
jgi:hypothetical protein